jgi:hypothetical protein
MSALGQKRTSSEDFTMSALPPKADIRPRDQDVCFGPKGDIGPGQETMRPRLLAQTLACRDVRLGQSETKQDVADVEPWAHGASNLCIECRGVAGPRRFKGGSPSKSCSRSAPSRG